MIIREIEKNIPFPGPASRSKYNYPWREMEVGDSVLIKSEEHKNLESLRRKISTSTSFYESRSGKKFKTMLMHSDHGVRVWRVE